MSYPIGSLKDVLNWAKGRDPNEIYYYDNLYECALARYFRERTGDPEYYVKKFESGQTRRLEDAASGNLDTNRERTMGAFVQRLEDELSDYR